MTNPELIAVVVAGVQCGVRLIDALIQRILLRTRIDMIECAARVDATVEMADTGRHDTGWWIRIDRRRLSGRGHD